MANLAQAIRLALHYGETHLGVTDIFGEDVGPPLGGVFTATQGLTKTWNTPLDERGILGMAMGIALAGGKPVAEIQFCDYMFNAVDLMKLAGNAHWTTNGGWHLPMVVMTPVGAGIHGSIYHSHSIESIATHLPGWKIVMPSNAKDAYGLLISAMQDPNPVLYMAPKALLRVKGDELIPGEPADERELHRRIDAPLGDRSGWTPNWPPVTDFSVPIGEAKVCRTGDRVTVVGYGHLLPACVRAADVLAQEGIACEVIDLRTLIPFDLPTLQRSLDKTGRLLLVNEDTEVTNFGEHLLRKLVERCFYSLQVPPVLLAGADVPGVGLAWELERHSVPQEEDILAAMRKLATAGE